MLPTGQRSNRRRYDARGQGWGGSSQMVSWTAWRPSTVVVIVLAMLAGVSVVYLRLWAIDSDFSSSEDREFLRRQFDRANMEAMDESAEWRMKYDGEAERAKRFEEELKQAYEALADAKESLASSRKENANLDARLVALRREAEEDMKNCSCNLLPSKPALTS